MAGDSLAAQFEAAGITMTRELSPVGILGDPRRLHQVITNLLTNTLKFTPACGRVTIATGADGTRAVLTVADTGPGIPPTNCPASSTGSGAAARPRRPRAAASGWPSPPNSPWRMADGCPQPARQGRGTQMTLTLPTPDVRGHGGGDDAPSGTLRESHRTGSVL